MKPVFEVSAVSDQGLVRKNNEDSILVREEDGLFAVADGMGGGAHGELASRWMCDALDGAKTRGEIERAIKTTNEKILYYAKAHRYRMMGTTLALVLASPGGKVMVGWIGDSRIYHLHGGKIRLVTCDHTVRNAIDAVAKGTLQIPKNDFERMIAMSVADLSTLDLLTRAVGMEERLELDRKMLDVVPGDRILICSDGVYSLLGDDEIGRCLASEDAILNISALVRERGASDNFSMIVMKAK